MNIIKTKIYNFCNLNTFMPKYANYWVVAANTKPFSPAYEEKCSQIESNLWYVFKPEEHDENWLDYYKEKLALDAVSGRNFQNKWNKAVKEGVKQSQIDHVVIEAGIEYAFLNKDESVKVFMYASHIPALTTRVYEGSGGYAWTQLKKDPLPDDSIDAHRVLHYQLGMDGLTAPTRRFMSQRNQFIRR